MANRYTILRKKLIKEAVVLAVGVCALAALGMLVQNYAEDNQAEQHNKESELQSSRTKLESMRKDMENSRTQYDIYSKYAASHNPSLTLNREEATKWFIAQREKFHMVNLSITIPPFSEVKDGLALKSGTMIKSEVKLSFGTLTDNSIFALIAEMQHSLPGIVAIQEMKITRGGELSSNVLVELSNHHITPLVTTEITFSWFGVRPNDVKPADAKGPPNAH